MQSDEIKNVSPHGSNTMLAAKKDAKEIYQRLWQHIVELDETVGLETSTYKELQAKISSKVAQCDKSIQDHEKLLTKINCHCDNEIKTGQTSVMCCNICGKPDEDFWTIGQENIVLCDYCGHLETEHEENCLKSPETKAELLINIHQQLIDEITETNGDESNAISHSLITVNMIKAVLPDGDLMAFYSAVRQILINKLPTDR